MNYEEQGKTNKQERIKTVILYGVFICYIILLFKLLFLSRVSFSELLDSQRAISRSINLIPFYSIWEYLFSGSEDIQRFAFGNVAGNIAVFIPVGMYLSLLKRNKRMMSNLLLVFFMSFMVEIVQGLLGIGAMDIDDIILNCLGGLIGILGYKLLIFVLRYEKRVRTVIAVLSVFVGLPVIYYYLFMIKMRF